MGRPKKVVEPVKEKVNEQPKEAKATETVPVVESKPVLTGWDAAIAESRKLLDVPLSKGQAYFESPEGFIMIDQEDRGRVWCRSADKGKGMWINPRRV